MKDIFKYLFYAGLLLAIVGIFVEIPFLGLILLLIGILSGVFFFDYNDLVNFGVRYLLFGMVSSAFGAFPAIGMYLDGIFAAVFSFYGPIALTMLVMFFINKYFMAKPAAAPAKKTAPAKKPAAKKAAPRRK